jgi:undecaprenyl-diphosphatase
MRALSAGLIGLGLMARRPRLARAGLRMLVAHELATAVKNFVKRRVDRTRPRSLSEGEAPEIRAGSNRAKEATSFPSGTAPALRPPRAPMPASFRNTGRSPMRAPGLSRSPKSRAALIIRATSA